MRQVDDATKILKKVSPGQQAAVDAFLAAFGDFHSGWAGGFKVAKAVAGA